MSDELSVHKVGDKFYGFKRMIGGQRFYFGRQLGITDEGRTSAGKVGLIGGVMNDEQRAFVMLLRPTGEVDGAMFLPLDCLKVVHDPLWDQALSAYRRIKAEEDLADFCRRLEHQQQIELIADKYQMTVDAVLEIAAVVTGGDARQYYY